MREHTVLIGKSEGYEESCLLTLEALEAEPEPVLAEDQHTMLEPVTEERAIESACAEPMAGREPDEAPPDLEPSPCTAPLCEAPCEGVSEDSIVADGGDGICDKMSEHLRGPN